MNKEIAKVSLFMALGIGLINPEYAQASPDLAECFNNQVNFDILAKAQMEQADYYLVDILSFQGEPDTNVIKIERKGNCYTVVEQEQLLLYPLTNFLGKEIAENLLSSKYLTLKEQLGGTEALAEALLDELEADSPSIFFEEDIEVLEKLGVHIKGKNSSIVIVGKEGIPGHPELHFKE